MVGLFNSWDEENPQKTEQLTFELIYSGQTNVTIHFAKAFQFKYITWPERCGFDKRKSDVVSAPARSCKEVRNYFNEMYPQFRIRKRKPSSLAIKLARLNTYCFFHSGQVKTVVYSNPAATGSVVTGGIMLCKP